MTNPSDLATLLLTYEQALLNPQIRRDRLQAAALLADDFREFGSSGRVWNKTEILDFLAEEKDELQTLEDFHCTRLSEILALVTYRAVRANLQTGAAASTLRSSLWTQQSSQWRMLFHQGTNIP